MRELGDVLKSNGEVVEYVASAQTYRDKNKNTRRFIRELKAACSLLWRGCRARRPDLVISGSSPPCLLIVATLVAFRHRARTAHWAMDLYPELALALGELRQTWISETMEKLMGWAYRRTDAVVALDDDMAGRLNKHHITNTKTIRPWVPLSLLKPPPTPGPNAEQVWIYSGNLGRAHEWETLLQAQAELEQRGSNWRLLFQGGGSAWPMAQKRARELNLQRCEWKSYVEEENLRELLLRSCVLVVTQRPETQGLLWPSKLSLAMDIPRRILWVGPVNGAAARTLAASPYAGIFAPGQSRRIADWLEATPNIPVDKITDAATHRESALAAWAATLHEVASTPGMR